MTGRHSGASGGRTAAGLRVANLGAVALLLLLLAEVTVSAGDVSVLVAPLMSARERAALGSVDGRAYEEGRRGGAEATPYGSVSVLLLPRSVDFEAELTAIKAHSHDSPDAYFEAEPKVRAARLAFQQVLTDGGAGQLIFGAASDASGAFRFPRVPEGAWTVLAWRETAHATKRPAASNRTEAQRFKTRPQVFGHTSVIFWRMPITVKAGEAAEVRLHDRNEWMTAVREDRRVPDSDHKTTPSTQQGAAPR